MTFFKILFSIIGLLIFVCVLAVTSLIIFVDPNKLKPVIIEEVMQQTGYQLAIEGKLSWSFYPRMSVKVDRMLLSSPNQPRPFIDARDIKLGAELSQLWSTTGKLQGSVFISNMRLVNIHADNINATLHWENHVLTLQSIDASLYGGTLQGIVIGHDLSAIPYWQWDMQGSGIEMKQLLQDVNSTDSRINISGLGQIKLQGESRGKDKNSIIEHLNGAGEFSLHHGVVEGIDLNYLVQSADALLHKESIAMPVNSNQTVFDGLTGTWVIKNGITETNNMLLTSSAFTAKAQGSMVLLSRKLDFRLQVKPQQTARTQWEIPVLISGDLKHPSVSVDTMEIQHFFAEQELDKLKDKAVEQIKKHVSGKASEFLQNLLGG